MLHTRCNRGSAIPSRPSDDKQILRSLAPTQSLHLARVQLNSVVPPSRPLQPPSTEKGQPWHCLDHQKWICKAAYHQYPDDITFRSVHNASIIIIVTFDVSKYCFLFVCRFPHFFPILKIVVLNSNSSVEGKKRGNMEIFSTFSFSEKML